MDDYEPEYEPESVVISPDITLNVMTLVPPPLEYMVKLHDSHSEISGRKVWCGSLLLTQYLLSSPVASSLAGKCIVELGAGTGVVGLSLCLARLPSVLLVTDGDPLAVDLLHQNLPLNGIPQQRVPSPLGTALAIAPPYLWGPSPDELSSLRSFASSFWPSSFPSPSAVAFDVAVAGDVLYKSFLPPLFFSSVSTLLKPGGVLYLCHVPRADVGHDVVVKAADDAGFDIQRIDEGEYEGGRGTLPDGCPREDAERARIYRVTRKL